MVMKVTLDGQDDLDAALDALATQCPVMARLRDSGLRPPLRRREPGFPGLAWIVVGQQLSVASARAIWGRLEAKLAPPSPETFLAASDADLKACGLSAPKIRTLRGLSERLVAGAVALDELAEWPADAAQDALVALPGIGPWTAQIYLLFCLGHADAFPAGDLALQEAARDAFGLPARPREKEFLAFAERWRPWRGAAAKMLWAHYHVMKAREGVGT
jgi:DNA-3-methyladenine glycosylase II